MIHLLSPAKSLDFESELPIKDFSLPQNKDRSEKLISKLKTLSKKKLREMMSISEDLANLNAERYQEWEGSEALTERSRQAIFAFKGDVYQGLQAYQQLTEEDVDYAQDHLIILSGLYGILRPKDLIEPYRLEMGTQLKVGRNSNLYEFWGDQLTKSLNEQLEQQGDDIIVNLASNEYFNVLDKKKIKGKIISPEFKDAKNGKYKFISFYGKKARGLMSRYIIKNRIDNPEDLKGFDLEGYRYNSDLSKEDKPVFTREENQTS